MKINFQQFIISICIFIIGFLAAVTTIEPRIVFVSSSQTEKEQCPEIQECPEIPKSTEIKLINQTCPKDYEQEYETMAGAFNILSQFTPIEIAYQSVKNNEYIFGKYDCEQFSMDFQDKLRELGYDSIILTGFTDFATREKGIMHTWIGIFFEPQTGKLIKVNENYKATEMYNR